MKIVTSIVLLLRSGSVNMSTSGCIISFDTKNTNEHLRGLHYKILLLFLRTNSP